jgi:hypothetical protein
LNYAGDVHDDEVRIEHENKSVEPHLLDQGDFNDLVRDLKLSKYSSELLGSRLREWNLLQKNTKITDQRKRSHEFQSYFTNINSITFCCNVTGLMQDLFGEYDSTEWRLFIDGSVKSLIAVLLHNGNEKPSVPVAHAVDVKESYESIVGSMRIYFFLTKKITPKRLRKIDF